MNSSPAAIEFQPCVKCGQVGKKSGEFRAAGGFLSSFFDVATERFVY
jgi:predicted nucleic-acid-binding Zn-ribbon protein